GRAGSSLCQTSSRPARYPPGLRLAGVVGRADTRGGALRPRVRGGGDAGVVGGAGVAVRPEACGVVVRAGRRRGGDVGLAVRGITLVLARARGGGFCLVDRCLAGGVGLAAVRDLGGPSRSVLGKSRDELALEAAGHTEAVSDARGVGDAGAVVGVRG